MCSSDLLPKMVKEVGTVTLSGGLPYPVIHLMRFMKPLNQVLNRLIVGNRLYKLHKSYIRYDYSH